MLPPPPIPFIEVEAGIEEVDEYMAASSSQLSSTAALVSLVALAEPMGAAAPAAGMSGQQRIRVCLRSVGVGELRRARTGARWFACRCVWTTMESRKGSLGPLLPRALDRYP